MREIAIHKFFAKELKKAKLNPTNSAKLFLYISLLLNDDDLPSEVLDHALRGSVYLFLLFYCCRDSHRGRWEQEGAYRNFKKNLDIIRFIKFCPHTELKNI